jgi:hypothetical protein
MHYYAFLHKENTLNFVSRVGDPTILDRIRIPLAKRPFIHIMRFNSIRYLPIIPTYAQ